MGCTGSDGFHSSGGDLEPELEYYLNQNTQKKVSDQKPDSNLF